MSLKILFCNYEYPPLGGGGGVVMAALARELGRRHEVTVLTSNAFDLPADSHDGTVRVVRTPVFFRRQIAVANFPSMLAYLPSALVSGLNLGRRGAFDVVNTHFVVPTGPAGQMLASLLNIPNVLSVHGGDLYDPSKRSSPHRHRWLRGPIRRMLNAADSVVGQSQNTIQHARDIYGVRRTMELVPLGIERPPKISPGRRADFGLPDDAFVLTTVGRLVARKTTTQLVRALQESRLEKAHLLVVGDGPDSAAVRQAAAEAGLSARVHLIGQVDEREKYAALSVSDAFVSTSQHEGFGLVFLEAMAMALPIVCYDHGGQTDYLTSYETGHVVRLNDIDAFTRALIDLHADESKRRTMGVHNRMRAEAFFIDSCAQRYEDIFMDVHSRRARRVQTARNGVA